MWASNTLDYWWEVSDRDRQRHTAGNPSIHLSWRSHRKYDHHHVHFSIGLVFENHPTIQLTLAGPAPAFPCFLYFAYYTEGGYASVWHVHRVLSHRYRRDERRYAGIYFREMRYGMTNRRVFHVTCCTLDLFLDQCQILSNSRAMGHSKTYMQYGPHTYVVL